MSDPIERLREDARRTGGVGHERPDLTGSLARIHERASGFEPGGLTRQKRARVGVWSVAGVGAVAAAGLVVSGVLTPGGGTSPQAAPSTAPVVTPQGGAVEVSTVAYVHRARTALADADLDSLVLSIRTTDHHQDDDGTNASTTVERQVLAGDGTASRSWVPAVSGKAGAEDQEARRKAPGKDRTTTWWVSPSQGVYTRFVVEGLDSDDNPSAQATRPGNRVAALRERLQEIEHAMTLPGVTVSGPTRTTVDGLDATCVKLSGDGATAMAWIPQVKSKGTIKDPSVLSWSARTCFDSASHLPVLDTYATHRDRASTDAVTNASTKTTYQWLPRDAASAKLLAPDLDGLQQVSRDRYVQLTK